MNFRLKDLEKLPTLAVGQADDLKIDKGNMRVWLSRMTVADGMPYNNQVNIERYINNSWRITDTFEAV